MSKSRGRPATVEDAPEDDDNDNDSFAPGGDADYFAEEDGEGRFFGGGLTDEQKKILNIFDGAGGEGAAAEDVSAIIAPDLGLVPRYPMLMLLDVIIL
jgi:beta-catenin-like protein 1